MKTNASTQADESQRSAAVQPAADQRTIGARDFVDSRPQVAAQRKLMQMMSNSPQALQQKARMEMMAASPRAMHPIQRVSDAEVAAAEAACDQDTARVVKLYSQGWKSKTNATKQQIFTAVQANQARWDNVRDHVMLGGAGAPPTGYHSTAAGDAATSECVGVKSPLSAGRTAVYKQWTKARGQVDNANLKISTFFPDGWTEDKVRACVMLSFVGAAHRMQDSVDMAHPGNATFYPDYSNLNNPPPP
jgi:hypothetical protein